ncbi:4Fe-4S dicluster domain-containing protein [bacterium]|nr:4Fe-4S dicluster domain-containing protein [bacterium]
MTFRLKIDPDRCKACEMCIAVCPKKIIRFSEKINKTGFRVVACVDEDSCTGCQACALVCPEVAIEIFKETEA